MRVHLNGTFGYGRPRVYYGPGDVEVPDGLARALGLTALPTPDEGAHETVPGAAPASSFPGHVNPNDLAALQGVDVPPGDLAADLAQPGAVVVQMSDMTEADVRRLADRTVKAIEGRQKGRRS